MKLKAYDSLSRSSCRSLARGVLGTHDPSFVSLFKANNPQQVAKLTWQSGEYPHLDIVWSPPPLVLWKSLTMHLSWIFCMNNCVICLKPLSVHTSSPNHIIPAFSPHIWHAIAAQLFGQSGSADFLYEGQFRCNKFAYCKTVIKTLSP